jgi:hypothetical protein
MIVSAGAGIATVTAAVPLAEPEVVVIVAVPSATDVTAPDEETVATDAADEAHDTLAPLIVAPFWSLTVAESCCVAPIEIKLKLVGETVIEVATGVGVGVGAVGVLSPPQLHNNSENNTAHNSPAFFMPSFCSTPLRPATQDAQNSV